MNEALQKLKDAGFSVMESEFRGLAKTSDKTGDWFRLTLWVHPNDFPNEMFALPLRSRIGVAMVQIADDETEKPVKRKFEDLSRTQQAAIRCQDPAFQDWVGAENELTAKHRVYKYCHIGSLTELSGEDSTYAASKWDILLTGFTEETRLPEQR